MSSGVPCEELMNGLSMLPAGDRKQLIDSWRSTSPSAGFPPAKWDIVECFWDRKWHGCRDCQSVDLNYDNDRYSDYGQGSNGGFASHSHISTKRLLSKVQSWIRELEDSRRGVIYTKNGPCNLLEDWPIPAYPEDYDWESH